MNSLYENIFGQHLSSVIDISRRFFLENKLSILAAVCVLRTRMHDQEKFKPQRLADLLYVELAKSCENWNGQSS